LAQRTNALAVSTLGEGKTWASGYSNIFLYPEFANMELSIGVFSLLDQMERLQELFFHYVTGLSPVEVLFGEDLGWQDLRQIGVCATRVRVHGQDGAIGVVGPARLEYQRIIPTLRYFKKLIEEVSV
jgi:transcriptional regulator of heat shock response